MITNSSTFKLSGKKNNIMLLVPLHLVSILMINGRCTMNEFMLISFYILYLSPKSRITTIEGKVHLKPDQFFNLFSITND